MRHVKRTVYVRFCIISIHAPTRGATSREYKNRAASYYFNPRTHTGCDVVWKIQYFDGSLFQSTHPHGVRLLEPYTIKQYEGNFNPRTHTGCDGHPAIKVTRSQMISIHAPTRGATAQGNTNFLLCLYFNPRTHTGCDCYRCYICCQRRYFNPRTHTGCDQYTHAPVRHYRGFQSTHPHGVRLNVDIISQTCKCYFNPRTHTGCDRVSNLPIPTGLLISIHAPTRGATRLSGDGNNIQLSIFQSTHPHGVRPAAVP